MVKARKPLTPESLLEFLSSHEFQPFECMIKLQGSMHTLNFETQQATA